MTNHRNDRAIARTETANANKPTRRRRWADVAAALECRDEVSDAIAAFLSGEIDAPEFHKRLEEAAERDRAK
jgi:hypothetical protein